MNRKTYIENEILLKNEGKLLAYENYKNAESELIILLEKSKKIRE